MVPISKLIDNVRTFIAGDKKQGIDPRSTGQPDKKLSLFRAYLYGGLTVFLTVVAIVIAYIQLIPAPKTRDQTGTPIDALNFPVSKEPLNWDTLHIVFFDPPVHSSNKREGHRSDVYLQTWTDKGRFYVPWQLLPANSEVWWSNDCKLCAIYQKNAAILFKPGVASVKLVRGSHQAISYWLQSGVGKVVMEDFDKVEVDDADRTKTPPFISKQNNNLYVPFRLAAFYYECDYRDVANGGDISYKGISQNGMKDVEVYLKRPYESILKGNINRQPINWSVPENIRRDFGT